MLNKFLNQYDNKLSNLNNVSSLFPFTAVTENIFSCQLSDRFKAKHKRSIISSNAYRQRFGHSDLDFAEHGPLQGLDSFLQAGILQISCVDIHESVSWQQSTILLCNTIGNQ